MALVSTPITLIIIVCIVMLNVAAVAVTNRYPVTIDLTSKNSSNSLKTRSISSKG
jgi:hypothetical protein